MRATLWHGQVTYTGFNPIDNGKWLIETKDNYTYVNFQDDEFSQTIFGYVIRQNDGKYKAFRGLDEKTTKYFDTVDDGIVYVKSFKEKERA